MIPISPSRKDTVWLTGFLILAFILLFFSTPLSETSRMITLWWDKIIQWNEMSFYLFRMPSLLDAPDFPLVSPLGFFLRDYLSVFGMKSAVFFFIAGSSIFFSLRKKIPGMDISFWILAGIVYDPFGFSLLFVYLSLWRMFPYKMNQNQAFFPVHLLAFSLYMPSVLLYFAFLRYHRIRYPRISGCHRGRKWIPFWIFFIGYPFFFWLLPPHHPEILVIQIFKGIWQQFFSANGIWDYIRGLPSLPSSWDYLFFFLIIFRFWFVPWRTLRQHQKMIIVLISGFLIFWMMRLDLSPWINVGMVMVIQWLPLQAPDGKRWKRFFLYCSYILILFWNFPDSFSLSGGISNEKKEIHPENIIVSLSPLYPPESLFHILNQKHRRGEIQRVYFTDLGIYPDLRDLYLEHLKKTGKKSGWFSPSRMHSGFFHRERQYYGSMLEKTGITKYGGEEKILLRIYYPEKFINHIRPDASGKQSRIAALKEKYPGIPVFLYR